MKVKKIYKGVLVATLVIFTVSCGTSVKAVDNSNINDSENLVNENLSTNTVDSSEFVSAIEGGEIEMSDTLKVIANRKAIRSFLPEQITEEELNIVLMAGSSAPIGLGEKAYYKLTVVQDKEFMSRISDATEEFFNYNPLMSDPMHGAPTLVIISTIKDRHPEFEGLEIASAACIADTMLIGATDLGLGSVYICNFVEGMHYKPELIEELGLEEGYVPVAGVLIGYPKTPITYDGELTQSVEVNYIR
ncbi:MAG: nitroreductase family protein [Lachnospirales bacterium]